MFDDVFCETLCCSRDEFYGELVKTIRDNLNNGIHYGYKLASNGELLPNIRQQRIMLLENNLKNRGHTFEEINRILADEVIFTQEEIESYKERNQSCLISRQSKKDESENTIR